MRRVIVISLAAALACAGCGGGSAVSALRGRMLSVSDLPAGWKSAPVPASPPRRSESPCLAALPQHPKGAPDAAEGFVLRLVTPSFGEALMRGSWAMHAWPEIAGRLARCRTATVPVDGHLVPSTVRPLKLARIGDRSWAFAWSPTTSLISALGLGRPDVLGWSMGTMIAQALAVLHPAQVGRLILCAGYPGNGGGVRPAQAAIDALNSGDQPRVMSVLFPADQAGAQKGYLAALTSQGPSPAVPEPVVAAQATAVQRWWSGQDPAGRRAAEITAPTLIADGTVDRLDPTANSRTLAKLIPGARLVLYPDAGHAFLFQDQAALVVLIERFLGAGSAPSG